MRHIVTAVRKTRAHDQPVTEALPPGRVDHATAARVPQCTENAQTAVITHSDRSDSNAHGLTVTPEGASRG